MQLTDLELQVALTGLELPATLTDLELQVASWFCASISLEICFPCFQVRGVGPPSGTPLSQARWGLAWAGNF